MRKTLMRLSKTKGNSNGVAETSMKAMAVSKLPAFAMRDGKADRGRDLSRREVRAMLIAGLLQLAVSGCQVSGDYPRDWPEPAKKELVGKCPSIAGKYRNVGIGHPKEAGTLLLTRLFDLEQGEQVEIAQSPEKIEMAVWMDGSRSGVVTFTTVWLDPFGDRKPRLFTCPIAIPGGRFISFADLDSQAFGGIPGFIASGSHQVSLSTAEDGSLIVTVTDSGGVLMVLVPVGRVDRVYYRFERMDQ